MLSCHVYTIYIVHNIYEFCFSACKFDSIIIILQNNMFMKKLRINTGRNSIFWTIHVIAIFARFFSHPFTDWMRTHSLIHVLPVLMTNWLTLLLGCRWNSLYSPLQLWVFTVFAKIWTVRKNWRKNKIGSNIGDNLPPLTQSIIAV